MPLFEKARVEVYLPDLPKPAYQTLLDPMEQEFSHTFGGCTIVRGLSGSYLSSLGLVIPDRINLIYTDTPLSLAVHLDALSRYTDELRDAAFRALDEEAILVVVYAVHHSSSVTG